MHNLNAPRPVCPQSGADTGFFPGGGQKSLFGKFVREERENFLGPPEIISDFVNSRASRVKIFLLFSEKNSMGAGARLFFYIKINFKCDFYVFFSNVFLGYFGNHLDKKCPPPGPSLRAPRGATLPAPPPPLSIRACPQWTVIELLIHTYIVVVMSGIDIE